MGISVTDTAVAIARVRAEESLLPRAQRLFDDPFAHRFSGNRITDELFERFLTVPFFRLQVRLRTRFIDDVVRTALAEGVRQIVVLGAGFDCRALRLIEIEQTATDVFEVDLATQLTLKRSILEKAGVSLPRWLQFVPCDFSGHDWESVLLHELGRLMFRRKNPCVFICEGVFSYLTHAEIRRTLGWMASSAGPGSKSVFNYTVLWISTERTAELTHGAGFRQLEDLSLENLHQRYLAGAPPPGGDQFRIAIAQS